MPPPFSGGKRSNAVQLVSDFFLSFFGIVIGLQAKPESGRGTKCTRQAQGSICGNGAFAGTYLADAHGADANRFGKPVLTDLHWLQKLLQKYLAGMNVWQFFHFVLLSVVIGYLNIIGNAIIPHEANSPLLVNSDAPLAVPISGKLFETIRRWYAQVINDAGVV